LALDTVPGTAFAYSNFGYCLLGRVIERLSGQSYEAYVRDVILRRCGIQEMQIAGNTLAGRQPDEVRYCAE
jgi:CubicO group peptidase (beta-lactamase class C family)